MGTCIDTSHARPGGTRRLAAAVALALALTTAGACSSDSGSDTAAPTTQAPGDGTPAATAAPTTEGPCPEETEVTVTYGSTGSETTETFTATSAKVDVTLDSSAQFVLADYDIPDDEVESIAAPTVAADKHHASFYISAALDKETLEPGLYEQTSSAEPKNLQFNREDLYTADGRQFLTGFVDGESTVQITEITDQRICGEIDTPMIKSRFNAAIVDQ